MSHCPPRPSDGPPPTLAATPPSTRRLLLVDDDPHFGDLIREGLANAGFSVDLVSTPVQMRQALGRTAYSLVLIELRLRNASGLAAVRRLRAESGIPIIMISAHSDERDRVLALELGADDFLTKPFGMRELQARLRAVLRRYIPTSVERTTSANGQSFAFGPWVLDLGARELQSRDGMVRDLTYGEFRLLEIFVRQPHRLLTRDELIDRTRSAGSEVYDRSVDILVLRLRRKIEPNPRHPQFINTERGQGYIFNAEVTALQ